jgi:thiosulfate reductase / polysulfide reductase chain A
MDRRKFLKFSAGGATTAAVAASLAYIKPFGSSLKKEAERLEIPTTCEMCVNKCSLIAVVENGVIHKLNPNPENPKSRSMLCARGNAGLLQVYDSARLKRPLIRVGNRGEGNWRPASWDEAFDFTAKKLTESKALYGRPQRASRRFSFRTWERPLGLRTKYGIPRSASPR